MTKSKVLRAALTVLWGSLICLIGLASQSSAQIDPGLPDSLIIGNFDRSPILAGLNAQITVPVYIKTDDSVIFVHIPVATDDDYVASRNGGIFYPPLTLWDDRSFLNPDLNSPSVGHTSQSILGFAYLLDPRDPQNFLYTNYQWVHIADFRLTTTGDIAVLGDTMPFTAGHNPQNGNLVTGLENGITEVVPQTVWGSLFFPPNNPPSFIEPDSGTYPVNEQFGARFTVTAVDPDTDSMVLTADFGPTDYTFQQLQNIPGRISFRFIWVPGPGSAGTYPLSFTVNDGNGGVLQRNLTLEVSPAGLSIGSANALPGASLSLPVAMDNQGSSSQVGGFEILVTWNPTALSLNGVTRAGRLGSFEYFHITYDDVGEGTARVVGIADIRNGVVSPPLQPGTGTIFYLEMSVAPDESLIGVELPVSFLNLDQTDNTVSDSTGYLLVHPELTNGTISVRGPGDVLTGDINLNGIPYEVADVVIFVNHLTNPVLFPFDPVQREASDVNADGIPETVADLVYLINIVNHSIPPPPKTEPIYGGMMLSLVPDHGRTVFRATSQVDLGGILMKISHPAGATLVPQGISPFTLGYSDDGNVLTVLAYLPESGLVPAGAATLFTLDAEQANLAVLDLSASDAAGHLIPATSRLDVGLPESYELSQNFPNPFNATTTIAFGLPQASQVRLDLFSITGQKVGTLLDNFFEAGRYNVTWNSVDAHGKALSSGIYFYRLDTGNAVKTLKMTLLK